MHREDLRSEGLTAPLLGGSSKSRSSKKPLAEGNIQGLRVLSDFHFVDHVGDDPEPDDAAPRCGEVVEGGQRASADEFNLAHAAAPARDPLLAWIEEHRHDNSAWICGSVIPVGSVGFTVKDGQVGVLAAGRRRIWDPQRKLLRTESINATLIQMPQLTIVRVQPGEIGLALRLGSPVVLEEGRHMLAAPEWSFVGVHDATADTVSWPQCPAVKIVRVRPGKIAFIKEHGTPKVLESRKRPYELQAPAQVLVRIQGLLQEDVLKFDMEGSLDVVRVRPGNVALAWHNGSPRVLRAAETLYELRAPAWQFVKLADSMQSRISLDDKNSLDIVRVLPGKLGLCYEAGQPRVLPTMPEPYVLRKPQSQFVALVDQHTEHISLGSLQILTIATGRRGVVWINGQAQILEEGQAVLNEENFEYGGSAEVGEKDCSLGPFRFVTVGSGEVGKKLTQGRLVILEPGMHKLNAAEGETFHGFISVQQQVMKVAKLSVTTLDNVELRVDAVLTWAVSNPERAIRDVQNLHELLRQRTEVRHTTPPRTPRAPRRPACPAPRSPPPRSHLAPRARRRSRQFSRISTIARRRCRPRFRRRSRATRSAAPWCHGRSSSSSSSQWQGLWTVRARARRPRTRSAPRSITSLWGASSEPRATTGA